MYYAVTRDMCEGYILLLLLGGSIVGRVYATTTTTSLVDTSIMSEGTVPMSMDKPSSIADGDI